MKLIKILILIILLILLIYSLLNYHLLPVKGKSFLKNYLERVLEREVYIEKLCYSLSEGITLKNVSVKTKENIPAETLIKAKKVSFNILLVPLIVKRKIIITDLKVNKPYVNLIRKGDKELNIKDLLKVEKPRQKRKKFDVLVTSLEVSDGQLKFCDLSCDQIYEETLTDIFIDYNYSLPLTIKFKASANIEKENASFQCTGNYSLRTKRISLDGILEGLSLSRLVPFINLPIDINKFEGSLSTEFKSTIDSKKILTFKGKSQLESFNLKTQTLNIVGDASVTSNIKYDLPNKTILMVNGDINFGRTSVEGVPYVQRIVNLEGITTFNEKQITFKDLKGEILNCPTTFKGTLKNYQNPYLDLVVKSELNLNKVIEILPLKQRERFKDVKIKGQSYAKLNLKGEIKKLISLDMTGDISFSDVSIESAKLIIALTKTNGKIHLSKDKAELTDLTTYFKGTQYTVTGALVNFAKPHIELKIISNNLFCATSLDIANKIVYIKKAKGNYFSNEFELTGEVSNLESPDFNIYADLILDLSDIDKLFPQKAKILSKLELGGKCPGSMHFKGKLHQWKEAQAGFKSSAKKIFLKGLKLDNFYLNINMRNQKVFINNFSLDPYDGNLTLSGEIDLQKESPLYIINVYVKEVNLERLTKDTKLKDKEISGTAHLKLELTNPLKDISGPLGSGTILIIDGHLMELPLLKTLAGTIGLPAFEKVTFKEAYADFLIRNRNISTENLTLFGDSLTLNSKGSVDFEGNLNFVTNTELSRQTYENLSKGGQVASIFFDIIGKYLLRVKTTGTISNPEHKILPVSSEDLLKKGLIKGIEEILKGF